MNINIELNKKGLLSPFFVEVTYERTLYSHTVLQTKMHRPQKADSALFETEIRS